MKEESAIVENLENEVQEEVLKTVEENVLEEEKTEVTDGEVTADAEEVEETKEEAEVTEEKTTKYDEAAQLVTKARSIVKEADEQGDACKLLLSDDLKDYEKAKVALSEGGLDESEALLSELGYTDISEEPIEEESVVFEAKEDLEPIILQDVFSGKFTGLLLSLFVGVGVLAGFAFFAANKLGISFDVIKVPSAETLQTIFGWFGTQIGRPDDATNGGLLVGAVVLVIMVIVYMIRVSTKGSKNLHFAMNQLEEAEAYTAHKSNCKEEMDRVDAHIHDTIATLKTYQVLLNEQKGKLQRILYLEEGKEALSEYHEKSILEMRETQGLINSIQSLISTSMSEEGKLSNESTLLLHSAKSKMQNMIDRLY